MLEPVVAFVAHVLFVGVSAENEVVARSAEGLRAVLAGDDEVAAEAAEDQVDAIAGLDDVVAVIPLNVIVAAGVGDDVVAGPGANEVVAVAALDAVIAAIAPDRVVADTGDQNVVAIGAAEHDVLIAGVLQIVEVGPNRAGVVADDQRSEEAVANGIGIAEITVELPRLIDLEDQARRLEHETRQMCGVGVRHHHLGERVVLELGDEVEPRGTIQVVEPVAVLQSLKLRLEHEVEGRAEHAAERHLLLGQTADPQIDIIETGRGDAVCAARPGASRCSGSRDGPTARRRHQARWPWPPHACHPAWSRW